MKKFLVTVNLIVNPSRDSDSDNPETTPRTFLIDDVANKYDAQEKAERKASKFMSTWDIECREVTEEEPIDQIELAALEYTERQLAYDFIGREFRIK